MLVTATQAWAARAYNVWGIGLRVLRTYRVRVWVRDLGCRVLKALDKASTLQPLAVRISGPYPGGEFP